VAAEKKAKKQEAVPTAEERISLMPVQKSLAEPARASAQPLPSHVEGFQSFSLDDPRGRDEREDEDRGPLDPDSVFNLPKTKKGEDED
jgi:hypothetical protein